MSSDKSFATGAITLRDGKRPALLSTRPHSEPAIKHRAAKRPSPAPRTDSERRSRRTQHSDPVSITVQRSSSSSSEVAMERVQDIFAVPRQMSIAALDLPSRRQSRLPSMLPVIPDSGPHECDETSTPDSNPHDPDDDEHPLPKGRRRWRHQLSSLWRPNEGSEIERSIPAKDKASPIKDKCMSDKGRPPSAVWTSALKLHQHAHLRISSLFPARPRSSYPRPAESRLRQSRPATPTLTYRRRRAPQDRRLQSQGSGKTRCTSTRHLRSPGVGAMCLGCISRRLRSSSKSRIIFRAVRCVQRIPSTVLQGSIVRSMAPERMTNDERARVLDRLYHGPSDPM